MSMLHGKSAIVTGASRGMGRAFAVRLAEMGADVAAIDVLDSGDTLADITSGGRRGLALKADISAPDELRTVATQAAEALGPIDILINNAGVHPSMIPFEEIPFEFWRRTMSVNLDAMFLLIQSVLPGMKQAQWGRIINISSSSVNMSPPMGAPYVASKAGVVGLTRSLAAEVGKHGITVNAIAPNPVRTPGAQVPLTEEMFQSIAAMQPIPRVMEPKDVVGMVAFLCSDEADFITGQNLHVDGGMVRSG